MSTLGVCVGTWNLSSLSGKGGDMLFTGNEMERAEC